MLSTVRSPVRSPGREQAMVGHIAQAAAVDSHEPWIPGRRVLSHSSLFCLIEPVVAVAADPKQDAHKQERDTVDERKQETHRTEANS